MSGLFPLVFASDEGRLLTAIVIGFLFGFALERAGFANARKLAAQFYLRDLTVFKVMFTAILVAMVGLYTLVGLGVVDLVRLWINPTFVWGQLVGGFLLGVGFIMSGLCPGTSAVSAAAGRLDGLVTFAGIFLGTLVFALVIDWFPAVARLYEGGGLGVSVLPTVLHVPVAVFVLLVVVMAGAAFVGAERVERRFQARYGAVDLTPAPTRRTPRVKFAVAGALGGVALVSLAWTAADPVRPERPMSAIAALDLAEALIARDPDVVVIDLRRERPDSVRGIPGAMAASLAPGEGGEALLATLGLRVTVVIYDESGTLTTVPVAWPVGPSYRYLAGGLAAWHRDVLTPAPVAGISLTARARVERQHQIAAYFSGAVVETAPAAPPAALPAAGGAKQKRAGGC